MLTHRILREPWRKEPLAGENNLTYSYMGYLYTIHFIVGSLSLGGACHTTGICFGIYNYIFHDIREEASCKDHTNEVRYLFEGSVYTRIRRQRL